tara:strand:- start:117 stop:296 length:180 start_codon:yes stop_codon:yes gene_type:complete
VTIGKRDLADLCPSGEREEPRRGGERGDRAMEEVNEPGPLVLSVGNSSAQLKSIEVEIV